MALAQTQTTTTDYHICCNRLPHQFNDEERRQRFETAVPTDEPYGETDQTPETELADPVPLLERRPWDSSQSRATSKLRRGDREKAAAEVPSQARDEEKAAAEVPSRASGFLRRATVKKGDTYIAVAEYEEHRAIPEDTTPCDKTARVVGGCQGIEVREDRGDATSTHLMYLGTACTSVPLRILSQRGDTFLDQKCVTEPCGHRTTQKLATGATTASDAISTHSMFLGTSATSMLLGASAHTLASDECNIDIHRCTVFRKSLIHDRLFKTSPCIPR